MQQPTTTPRIILSLHFRLPMDPMRLLILGATSESSPSLERTLWKTARWALRLDRAASAWPSTSLMARSLPWMALRSLSNVSFALLAADRCSMMSSRTCAVEGHHQGLDYCQGARHAARRMRSRRLGGAHRRQKLLSLIRRLEIGLGLGELLHKVVEYLAMPLENVHS